MNGIIIGLGYMGKTHLQAYASIPKSRIVGIVDANKAQADLVAKEYGCKSFTSLDSALSTCKEEGTISFVDICLPSPFHREAAITAMDYGADVIIEKPLAVSLDDAIAIVKKAEQLGRRVMIAHVCRFMPQYDYIKNVVKSEKFGKPLFFGAWRQSEVPGWSKDNWLHDRSKSGGTIMDLMIHDIDIANWLFGSPKGFAATEVGHPNHSGCSHVVTTLKYANNAYASIEGGHLMPDGYPFLSGFRLVCEQGAIEWNTVHNKPGSIVEYSKSNARFVSMENETPANPYLNELNHFIHALETKTPFKVNLQEALLAVETVHNLLASMS